MNRHERRKAAAKARKDRVVTVEITPLLPEVMIGDPHGWTVLTDVVNSLGKNKRDCIACGTPWNDNLYPTLMARIRWGKTPKAVAVGAACQHCAQRLGVEGVGRAVAKYLDCTVSHVVNASNGGPIH